MHVCVSMAVHSPKITGLSTWFTGQPKRVKSSQNRRKKGRADSIVIRPPKGLSPWRFWRESCEALSGGPTCSFLKSGLHVGSYVMRLWLAHISSGALGKQTLCYLCKWEITQCLPSKWLWEGLSDPNLWKTKQVPSLSGKIMAKVIDNTKQKKTQQQSQLSFSRCFFSPPPAVCGPRLTKRTAARGPCGLWTEGDGVRGTFLLREGGLSPVLGDPRKIVKKMLDIFCWLLHSKIKHAELT